VSCRIAPLPVGAAAPLASLHGACFPEDPWDAEALDRILALHGGFGFLAWETDMPIGFALARDLGAECEILTLGVLPACRRRGVGRALLSTILAGSITPTALSRSAVARAITGVARKRWTPCFYGVE
jgi:GNAT superfamily N-acetyltransferase